jgi:carbonic anhydrase
VSIHLLRGHERFQAEFATRERSFLQRLSSEDQKPSTLYISCSDSRVIPELLTASRPGELFVVRNVANVVPRAEDPAAMSVGAAIEYAVSVLKVPHIVVCGHFGCGGVKAALAGREKVKQYPHVHQWLEYVEPAATKSKSAGLRNDELEAYAVEENVLDQMLNLISYPCVREGVDADTLDLHAWVYDIEGSVTVYDARTRSFKPYTEHLHLDSERVRAEASSV